MLGFKSSVSRDADGSVRSDQSRSNFGEMLYLAFYRPNCSRFNVCETTSRDCFDTVEDNAERPSLIKAPAFSAPQWASREVGVTSGSARFSRVLTAPKAGAHQVIDNQWNHELWHQSGQHKIPVALPSSVLTSLLSGLSDRNSLILLTLAFWHGFRPAWGLVTVDVRVRCIAGSP